MRPGLNPSSTASDAHRPARQAHRHRDDADLVGLAALVGRPHAQRRLLAHARHDDRPAGLEHAARELVERADPALRAAHDLVERLGVLALVRVEQDHAEGHAVVTLEDLEHAVQAGAQVERARQGLADVDERRQLADLVTMTGMLVGKRGDAGGAHTRV